MAIQYGIPLVFGVPNDLECKKIIESITATAGPGATVRFKFRNNEFAKVAIVKEGNAILYSFTVTGALIPSIATRRTKCLT